MLKSLQATVIRIELEGFEAVIRAMYQNPSKPLKEDNLIPSSDYQLETQIMEVYSDYYKREEIIRLNALLDVLNIFLHQVRCSDSGQIKF